MDRINLTSNRTLPLPFAAAPVGAVLHLVCAELPHDAQNVTGAWSDWVWANRPVVIACFDERSDYLAAELAPPATFASAPRVVREIIAELARFQASTSTVYDHDSLLESRHGPEEGLACYQKPVVTGLPHSSRMAPLRAERHRRLLLKLVTSRRLRSPADRDSALAAFVAMHNCSNPNDVLGRETPMDLLIQHRDGAERAKEAQM